MNLLYKLIFISALLWAVIGTAHSMDVYGLSEGIELRSEYHRNMTQNELLREALFDLAVEKTLVSFSNKKHTAGSHGYSVDSRVNLRATSETMLLQYQLTF